MAGSLTPREREVLSLLVKGRPNKTDRGGTRFRRVRGSGTRSELHVEDDNGLIANLVRLAETTKPESARIAFREVMGRASEFSHRQHPPATLILPH